MMSRHFPQRLTVTVDERNIVGAATGEYYAKILGQSAMTHDPSAIQMPARLVHFPGFKYPSNRAVMIEHCVAGHDLVTPVTVDVDGPWLMRRAESAGILDCPEQFAPLIVRPNPAVSVFDKYVGRIVTSGEVAEHQTCLLYTSPSPRDRS